MFEWIKNIFRRKKNMNEKENLELKELEIIIENYFNSKQYKEMIIGDNYYLGNHDILRRKKQGIGENGVLVSLDNVPNYKIVDNQFKGILDQKVNYLLSKPFSIDGKNEIYIESLGKIFNNKFLKTLFLLGKDAYKFGISWLYVYYNNQGELDFKKFDSREIIPVWKDKDHTDLDYVIRIYKTKEFDGNKYIDKENVEVYTLNGVELFNLKEGKLTKLNEQIPYIKLGEQAYNWERLPIIPFKANDEELPLISKVKSVQDSINEIISDFKNDMEQNWRNTIFVVKGYDPEGDKFRTNLNIYGVVGIEGDGDVKTLEVEVNSQNYESILKLLKNTMIENAKGFDAKSERLNGNPNQMNIQSMYSDIDLDANSIEREFQASLLQLLWFINQHLINSKVGDFTKEEVNIVFNRDILINESQAIEDCMKSLNVLSLESVIAQHPWVNDVNLELERLEKAKEELDNDFEELGHKHEKEE